VPDWSSGSPRFFLYHVDQPEFTFYSAGQSEAVVTFGNDSVKVNGATIGFIDLLGPQTGMKDYLDTTNGRVALRDLWEIIVEIYGSSMREHEAFLRTLTFDQIGKSRYRIRTERLRGTLGYFIFAFSNLDLAQAETSILRKHWKSFLALKRNDNPPSIDDDTIEEMQKIIMKTWIDVIFCHIWDRRFFISSSKAMGLASQEVMEGNLICIPLGCCHPVILRKVEDHYINLGEAYVDGYMYGEAMDMLGRDELKLEEFELL
jgi:hypothetical protein